MTFFEKTRRFFEPMKENKILMLLSIFKFAFWAIFALVSVFLIRESVRLYGASDFGGIQSILIIYAIFSVFYLFITWFLRMTDWPNLYYRIVDFIYNRYLSKLFLLDGNYLEKIGTGKLIAIISAGEKAWVEGLTSFLKEGTRITILLSVILYVFFTTDFLYGIVFLGVLFLLQMIVLYADNRAHKHRRERTEKKNEHTRQLVRIIMSRSEILQSGTLQIELRENEKIIQKIGDTNRGINSALFLIFNSVRVFIILLKLSLLGFLVYLGNENTITFADLAGLLALFLVFEGFMYDAVEFYKNFTKDFSDIEKIWEIFDNGPVMKGYDTGRIFVLKDQNIIVSDISYGYNESRVFDHFSLTIERGKKTALVGASGGGKTTLMKLIAGYLHPESGTISIMGNILDQTSLKSYYPHIGYLTQDPGVFDATIRENLVSAILHPSKSEEKKMEQKLIEVLKLAQCDFVFDLERGLDTEIGERGVRLSGGQKQRLAIAKIFLKDPEIILLDEPTSALDSFSEEKITEALDTLFIGRTVIIIAHRLQTVKRADDIIVIEGGEVIERGDHIALVEKGGVYSKMLDLQSGF